MKRALTENRGSVLMEFIIVMPIYFLLLGFVFVVGELSLHSIHLTASGDRNVAFTDAETGCAVGQAWERTDYGFWRLLGQVLSFDRMALAHRLDYATDYSYRGDLAYNGRASVSQFAEKLDFYARKRVLPTGSSGHWTEAVAGRMLDNYTLTPVTRGFVAHWFYETEKRVYDGKQMSERLNRAQRDDIDEILDKDKGALGRVRMKGNYYEDNTGKVIREYGYFSLRRSESAREPDKSYRSQDSKQLAGGGWKMAQVGEEIEDDEEREKTAEVTFHSKLYITVEEDGGSELKNAKGSGTAGASETYDFGNLL